MNDSVKFIYTNSKLNLNSKFKCSYRLKLHIWNDKSKKKLRWLFYVSTFELKLQDSL